MTQLFRGFPGSEIRGFGAPVPPTPASGKALGLPLGGQGQPGRAMARGHALRVHRFRGRSCHTCGHPGPSGDFRVATMVTVNEQFQWPFSHDRRKPRPRLGALPCAPVANALSPTFLPSFFTNGRSAGSTGQTQASEQPRRSISTQLTGMSRVFLHS